jgi:MoxR-like ATPase
MAQLSYTGRHLLEGKTIKDTQGQFIENIAPYLPDPELIKVVQYAIALKRPLLIKGEPGCGKTRLAQAVAYDLYQDVYRDLYFEWHVKSTTKALDGLYTFDHISRLRDANKGDIRTDAAYVKKGALGLAFETSSKPENQKNGHRPVLLIDEIDKADIDFPNDLLLELDQMRFTIAETGESVSAGKENPPIVIITSNDEKDLPPAFLRRCLFYYIEFPAKSGDHDPLKEIVQSHLPKFNENIAKSLVERFRKIRQKMEDEGVTDKKVTTSELLDWAGLIHFFLEHPSDEDVKLRLSKDARIKRLIEALEQGEVPPYYQALLKTKNDQKQFEVKK